MAYSILVCCRRVQSWMMPLLVCRRCFGIFRSMEMGLVLQIHCSWFGWYLLASFGVQGYLDNGECSVHIYRIWCMHGWYVLPCYVRVWLLLLLENLMLPMCWKPSLFFSVHRFRDIYELGAQNPYIMHRVAWVWRSWKFLLLTVLFFYTGGSICGRF